MEVHTFNGAKLPYGCEGGMPMDGYTGGGGAGR